MSETLRPGTILPSWISPHLEMRPSSIAGRGAFACQRIQVGEAVVIWGGTVFSGADILAGKANLETIAVLDDDLYLADSAGAAVLDEYSINHSCDSNLWMQDAITLAARREIAPGEELTADYALWLYDVDWVLDPCRCGAHLCRGRITSVDWRLPELQERYAGHFTPFLNRQIARLNGDPL